MRISRELSRVMGGMKNKSRRFSISLDNFRNQLIKAKLSVTRRIP